LLPLPSKEGSRTARCARPSSALRAPSPASGRRVEAVPGAQAGCAFFAPGFFAQAKKGGSRRHGAKAFDLDVGERAAGQDPPYGALAERLCLSARREELAASAAPTGFTGTHAPAVAVDVAVDVDVDVAVAVAVAVD